MVLNKRKPVHFIPDPQHIPDDAEVYVMRGTNEVFTDYEKFLKRFDWLNQKRFTDAVNGKSGLSYWDALESETKSTASIESVFPEVLRDPILRRIQFETISRIDELVNVVYDEFKNDFFPGETVICVCDDGWDYEGRIQEKVQFPMIRGADGSVQRVSFSRYFVGLFNSDRGEGLFAEKHVRRGRKVFTKQNLRAFLRHSLQREAWTGAPWLVKEHLAIQYRLPMEIPAHLMQDARLLANKQQMLQSRQQKPKRPRNMPPEEFARLQQEELRAAQSQQPNGRAHGPQHAHNHQPVATQPKPALPVIKYPIEDLDVPPRRNGVTRPELKFLTDDLARYAKSDRAVMTKGISMESVGQLLEIWNTLNVQCEVYLLDSFTFDDFLDAMQYSSTERTCELFEEVHCAVLKCFVDEQGKLQVKGFPKKVESEVEEAADITDHSEASTPLPDVPARSTRSRLSHMESAADLPDPWPTQKSNRAAEMWRDRNWQKSIVDQDFTGGGWQTIVVGILHQMCGSPRHRWKCESILNRLAPHDAEPTRETAAAQYATLEINLRIAALQVLTLLTLSTDKVKDFLEVCAEDMTEVRKRKIEYQRERKAAYEDYAAKDRERKILLPQNMPESPKEQVQLDLTEDSVETNGSDASNSSEDVPTASRSLRRASDRKRKRDEDVARREKERAEKAAAAKAQPKQSKEFKRVLHDIEDATKRIRLAEEKIAECDGDLREANVQRTKCLGKDRFCNRYWWFERNGQPFAGLPNSSTASYGYANGRVWVQGPDEIEREGFIDRSDRDSKAYEREFGMTVSQRRRQEHGAVHLLNAHEWGFYDDKDQLDALIGWLDERGERERKLKKELLEWREQIHRYMDATRLFLESDEYKRGEAEAEQESRINTRHKTQEDLELTQDRCLKWTNSTAVAELGHLHSQPIKRKERKGKRESAKGVAQVVISRSANKPLTRQGERHKF